MTAIYGDLAKDGGGDLVQLADDKTLIRDVLVLTSARAGRKRWRSISGAS